MRQAELREWCFFLGAKNQQDAAAELHRLITRLDESFDILNYVIKLLIGSPGGYAEESLVVSRTTITEAIEHLDAIRSCMGQGDPEVA